MRNSVNYVAFLFVLLIFFSFLNAVGTSLYGALNNGGWTIFTESVDTRKIFVSSTEGDDTNDGLTELAPKQTIIAGKALLRAGFPDWLLLRRGTPGRMSHWETGSFPEGQLKNPC